MNILIYIKQSKFSDKIELTKNTISEEFRKIPIEKLCKLVEKDKDIAMRIIHDSELGRKRISINSKNGTRTLSYVAVMNHKDVALEVLKYKELREESVGKLLYKPLAEVAVRHHKEAALFALSDPEIYKISSRHKFDRISRGLGYSGYLADVATYYHRSAAEYTLKHSEIFELDNSEEESLQSRIEYGTVTN